MDESGSTGNIKLNNLGDMNYLNERYFVLGSLKLNSIELKRLDKEVQKLMEKYNVKSKELKSKNLYRNKKEFLIEFFEYINKVGIRALAEIIDKKYQLSIQIIDNTINPKKMKRECAQWLTENLEDKDYKFFLEASEIKSKENFEKYINDLLENLNKKIEKYANEEILINDESIEKYIKNCLEKSIKVYKNLVKEGKEKTLHYRFLPIEDKSKNNKIYSHLPNVNCFMNLLLRGIPIKSNSDIKIIHDIQKEFEHIIKENLKLLKDEVKISNNIELEFKDSIESKGVQYSDLIAGTVHKVWRDYIIGNSQDDKLKKLYEALTSAVIINTVIPDSLYESNEKILKILKEFFFREERNKTEYL